MHHIQQGHTYANTAKTYLVNINAVNQWIARYKTFKAILPKDDVFGKCCLQ
jgi:hypothetical protein